MADALKAWLRTRLGVIIDLTPEMFGHYTRDGTLLAQILHSYDIISSSQLSTILCTQDPALSRVNLRTLRIWLKLINVTLSDECIDEISKGKGAAALQLFYKVYLSLEGKDRLHFIALQKERKYMPSRFDITKVSEDPPSYHPPEHPLSQPLIEAADTVLWHRNKFWAITQACRRERQRFEAFMKYPIVEPVEHLIPEELFDEKKIESETLDEFARKHPPPKMKKRYRVIECCPEKKSLDMPCVKDPAAAAEYTDLLKKRSEKAAKSNTLKLKVQTTMMTEAWERLLRKQDRSFDEALGSRVLDQSRYEKQMMRKLCEVRDLRNRIVENRRIVDAMLLKTRENELRLKEDRHREIMKEEMENVEMEDRRMGELRWRIREEKLRRIRKKHRDICLKIVEDLADIAVKIADYRQTNNNHIPPPIWNEWKTSFLRNQSMFELVDHYNDIEQIEDIEEIINKEETKNKEIRENKVRMRNGEKIRSKEEIKIEKKLKTEEKQKLIQLELERQRSLADADFESYQDLSSPWDEFVLKEEEKDEEVVKLGRIVLGYVVHRLLEILYPYPKEAVSSVSRVKVAAIISGIINPILHEQLRELLKNNGIRLVKMEDAINHCLEKYKQEMTDVEYIDLNIVSTTTRDIKTLETKSKTDDSDRHQKKIERVTKVITSQQSVAEEKQTQTPRQIPFDDMDPVLSDTAYIGKLTYEFLTLGEPICDELNTKILIEYLRGIENAEGWALINYPNTYEQMAILEKTLTGCEILSDHKIINFSDEDIDLSSARIVFESDEDTFATCRQSRLLPNPISRAKDSSTTFITIYVKAMLKSNVIDDQDQPCILLPADATSMDEYYANEGIAYGFFYNVLDLPTLTQLAEFIAGQISKKKLELSEKISQTHDEQRVPIDSKVVIKCLIPKSKWEMSKYEKKKDVEVESSNLQSKVQTQLANNHARPGEDDWQWINFFQPPALLEILATFWESIEEAYVENVKEILSLKRMHTSAILPYKNLVKRTLTKFIKRPDKRQVLLQDFHRAFNDIDEDLRDDSDMKCELHCRVDDFRMELWDLCDARRHEAEEERKRILRNEWIPMEAVVLINVYIGILQAEVDRFIDTMQLLQDYYTSMAQKPLQEPRFSKIVLDHVALTDILLETSVFEDKEQMLSKIESINASTRRAINMDLLKIEIETLLTDTSKSFDPDQSIIYNIIKDDIRQVRSVVDSISSTTLEVLKKEEKAAIPKNDIKGKSIANASLESTFAKLTKRSLDLIEEWRYAVLFEIDRINRRLDVLNAAARFNIIFLLDTMKETFHDIYYHIIERYQREIESINEMANVFCFAIEEERPIQQELLLDGDQFIVRSDDLMLLKDLKRTTDILIEEVSSPVRFRIVQLGRLVDIFRRIAPQGTISERALIYVLQDLVSCGEEDCYPPFMPCAWQQLRPPDIEKLIERLFGATEYIEWREFIVYAMDLPMPSHQDILKARTALRMHDYNLSETITRDQFHSTPLWFLEISTFHGKLLDDEIDCVETMDATLCGEVLLDEHISNVNSNFIETSENHSRAILRLALAKELLCRMYLVNRNTIHYTAMLLAFCKDEDPREGLGKAFTLVMGARVCTDAVEGERYVDKLIEKKRRDKELQLSQDYLREEANEVVREIIDHIMNRMTKAIIMLEKIHDHDLPPKRRIMIQQLNGMDEIDPAELLPPEEIAEHLITENLTVFSDEHEYESYFASADEVSENHDMIEQDERVIFWLPRNVCLTVLSTCLPWLALQPNLFQTSMSLREGVAHVYDELRDEELNDDKDLVLSHRLLNHSFIHELFCASNKFAAKNMTDLLRNILKDRHVTT